MPFSLVEKKSQKKPSFRRAFPYPDRQLQRLAAELPGEIQVVRTADRVVPVEVVVRVVDVAEVRRRHLRSAEHTSELQSLMRNSSAVFCLKKKNTDIEHTTHTTT